MFIFDIMRLLEISHFYKHDECFQFAENIKWIIIGS